MLIVVLIGVWVVLVVSIAPSIGHWPALAQTAFYLVTGIMWIAPLKPLLSWMETGRWR